MFDGTKDTYPTNYWSGILIIGIPALLVFVIGYFKRGDKDERT